MPELTRGATTIHYEERGRGFPALCLAPGGMRSTVGAWQHAAVDPWSHYRTLRRIAMDQRNAGASRGPLPISDPWGEYAADQLALLDHLGVDRFVVVGCCIGGSFILKLCSLAPERVVAAVLEQPIGVTADNRGLFEAMRLEWATELLDARPELAPAEMEAFLAAMWADEFVVSVPREEVARCPVPLLVLPGTDDYHPTAVGREIAELAPHAELLEPWKDSPEHVAAATEAVERWLLDHVPAS